MKKEPFNTGWTVRKENSEIRQAVTLPHDAMLREPRSVGNASTGACANFDGGCYHYEKQFFAPQEWADGHPYLIGDFMWTAWDANSRSMRVGLIGQAIYCVEVVID